MTFFRKLTCPFTSYFVVQPSGKSSLFKFLFVADLLVVEDVGPEGTEAGTAGGFKKGIFFVQGVLS